MSMSLRVVQVFENPLRELVLSMSFRMVQVTKGKFEKVEINDGHFRAASKRVIGG